jgi:hypothetical protein
VSPRAALALLWLCSAGCVENAYQSYLGRSDGGNADSGAMDGGPDAGASDGGSSDAGSADGGRDSGVITHCSPLIALPAICLPSGLCWENPLPMGDAIDALWANNADDVWVGGTHGALMHWDGGQWIGTPSPATDVVHGLWGSSASDLWLVGNGAMLAHWDCNAWSTVTGGPSSSTGNALRGVWGTGPQDVWIVGDDGAFHWDGGAWDTRPSLSGEALFSVWGDSPNNYWAAAGSGSAYHFDGAVWDAESVSTAPLASIWGSAAEVWAAGGGTIYHRAAGGAWSPSLVCVSTAFTAVWGSSTSDVWAAGLGGALWHYQGGSGATNCSATGNPWQPSTVTTLDLNTGGSVSNTEAWVAGTAGTVADLQGSTWEVALGGQRTTLYTVWAGPDGVLAAGTDDTGDGGFYIRQNGAWVPDVVAAGSPGRVTAISGLALTSLWAVDDRGQVWQRSATGWTTPLSLPGYSGEALFQADGLWTVGQAGRAWEAPNPGAPAFVNVSAGLGTGTYDALWGAGDQMWTVGAAGTFAYRDGGSPWVSLPSGTNTDTYGLWADSVNGTFFSVGAQGTIAQGTSSGLVNLENSPTTADLHGVWGRSAFNVWAVGDTGKILRFDGGMWMEAPPFTTEALNAVQGDDGGSDVWMVGSHGAVLHWK